MEKRIDLNDTIEFLTFCANVSKRLRAAKANDGQITLAEFGAIMAAEAQAGIAAFDGITDVPRELRNRSAAENEIIVNLSLPALWDLFNALAPDGWLPGSGQPVAESQPAAEQQVTAESYASNDKVGKQQKRRSVKA